MSDTNTPESKTQIQIYQEKGLTEKEAKVLSDYIEAGKPGLARVRADSMGTIYCLGYSCEDINRMFPEYPLGLLLHARVQYEWDKSKSLIDAELNRTIATNFLKTKIEAARFMMEMIQATHAKYRPEILKFLSNPEREEVPKVLPNSFHGYAKILQDLQELMNPGSTGGKQSQSVTTTPLVSVTVNTTETKQTKEVKADVKSELRKRADIKRGRDVKKA